MLFRIERQLIKGKKTASASKDHFNGVTDNLLKSQDAIKYNIRDASQGIQLDMRRLLDICKGLAVGVDRLDKR
jgi:hypothetical protein